MPQLCCMFPVTHAASQDASKHLELGKQMLSSGNLLDALSHFDSAVGKISIGVGWELWG